jgi:hypothetical protein
MCRRQPELLKSFSTRWRTRLNDVCLWWKRQRRRQYTQNMHNMTRCWSHRNWWSNCLADTMTSGSYRREIPEKHSPAPFPKRKFGETFCPRMGLLTARYMTQQLLLLATQGLWSPIRHCSGSAPHSLMYRALASLWEIPGSNPLILTKIFVVFLSLSRQMLGYYLKVVQNVSLALPSPFFLPLDAVPSVLLTASLNKPRINKRTTQMSSTVT